jgi:hypothetical protein
VAKEGREGKTSGDGISYADMLGLGVSLAVAVVIPLLLGLWLGGAAGAQTVGVLAGVALGIVAAGFVLYLRLRRYW